MEDEFDVANTSPAGRTTNQIIKTLQKDNLRKRQKIDEIRSKLKSTIAEKQGGRIQHIWLIRAGLAPPHVPLRPMAEFLRDFPEHERKNINYVTVAKSKDALCETIKTRNGAAVSKMVAGLAVSSRTGESSPVYVPHIHEEASMRLRSSVASPGAGATSSRSRNSKIQNNVVEVLSAGSRISFYAEMQPLMKKDGATISFALSQVVEQILVHCAKGLAENTNRH